MIYQRSFTLIELVITVTILAILAAVAIPLFQNIQTRARNASTQGTLGAIREAVSLYRMNEIASGRADGVSPTGWPHVAAVNDVTHGCGGVLGNHALANGDVPENPWWRTVHPNDGWTPNGDCVQEAAGRSRGTVDLFIGAGWFYNEVNGEFWANTSANGGPITENQF